MTSSASEFHTSSTQTAKKCCLQLTRDYGTRSLKSTQRLNVRH